MPVILKEETIVIFFFKDLSLFCCRFANFLFLFVLLRRTHRSVQDRQFISQVVKVPYFLYEVVLFYCLSRTMMMLKQLSVAKVAVAYKLLKVR